MDNEKNVPEVGKYYHFWDDGKCGASRHYICRVEELITNDKAKHINVNVPEWDEDKQENVFHKVTLFEQWKYQVSGHDWIYANETDYFVRITCPEYDEHDLYAVRTKNGGWFTIDIESFWQGGSLDVTGEIYDEIMNEWENENGYMPYDEYPPADEEHYHKRFSD